MTPTYLSLVKAENKNLNSEFEKFLNSDAWIEIVDYANISMIRHAEFPSTQHYLALKMKLDQMMKSVNMQNGLQILTALDANEATFKDLRTLKSFVLKFKEPAKSK